MTALLIVNPSDVGPKWDGNSISGKKKEWEEKRVRTEGWMKEAGGGKEVVDMLKRRQPALGLSKMRVLDLVILDHFCH